MSLNNHRFTLLNFDSLSHSSSQYYEFESNDEFCSNQGDVQSTQNHHNICSTHKSANNTKTLSNQHDTGNLKRNSNNNSPELRMMDENLYTHIITNPITVHNLQSQPSTWARSKNFITKLRYFLGPGWLIAMAYLDPGNLEGDIQIGGIRTSLHSGYDLLWLLLILHICGCTIQLMAVRLANVTGLDLASIVRMEYSKKNAFMIWVFLEFAIISADFQAIIGTSIALNLLFGLPIYLGVIITLLDVFTFLLLSLLGIRRLESFFCLFIFIMATCFWINFIASKPNPSFLFNGLFVPSIPPNSTFKALGLLGSVIMPHNLFLHSSLVCSRNINRSLTQEIKQANFYFTIETSLTLGISFLINFAVVSSFADPSIMLPKGGNLSLYNASKTLEKSVGGFATVIWAIGLFSAGQNATMAGTFAGQCVMEGILELNMSPWKRIIITRPASILPLISILFLTDSTLDSISYTVNILQAFLLPVALLPLAKICVSTKALGKFALSWPSTILISIICIVVIVSNFTLAFSAIIPLHLSFYSWSTISISSIIYVIWLFLISTSSIKLSYALYHD